MNSKFNSTTKQVDSMSAGDIVAAVGTSLLPSQASAHKPVSEDVVSGDIVAANGTSLLPPQVPADTPISAAEKVFGMPELLAEILLNVPTIPRSTSQAGTYSKEPQAWPAMRLYVLQRVNTTFQATIAGSKIMRQRMFLESAPTTRKEFANGIFDWLMSEIGIYDDRAGYLLEGPASRLSLENYALEGKRHSRPTGPEASWRKMKLYRFHDRTQMPIRFCYGALDELRCFSFDDDMTLGQINDGLQRLIPLMVDYDNAITRMERIPRYHGRRGDKKERKLVREAQRRLEQECDQAEVWGLTPASGAGIERIGTSYQAAGMWLPSKVLPYGEAEMF